MKLRLPKLRARANLAGARLKPKGKAAALWTRAALWTLAALTLFALLGFFAVPPIAKHYLVKSLSEKLQRQVAIEQIQVNPFALSVSLRGLTVKERNSSELFFSLDELFLDLQAQSLVRRGPILREIRLGQPFVHLVRNSDGSYNFSDLLQRFAADPQSPKVPPKQEQALRFSLNNIQIKGGRVDFDDRPQRKRHAVSDVEIAIPFFSSLPYFADQYVQPALSAKVNGTPFALKGRSKPFKYSLETSLELNLDRLDLPKYMIYVPTHLRFQVPAGLLSAKLTASFIRQQGQTDRLAISGQLGVEQFKLQTLQGETLLELTRLGVELETIDVFALKARIRKVVLEAPVLHVRRDRAGAINLLAIAPEPDGQPRKMIFELASVQVQNGTVHFHDEQTPPFKAELRNLEVLLSGFALPQQAPAGLEVKFDSAFGESFQHSGNVLLEPFRAQGDVQLSGLRPRHYAPYYAKQLLFDVEDGALDVSAHYEAAQEEGQALRAQLSEIDLSLQALRLRKRGDKTDFLSIKSTTLSDARFDLGKREFEAAELISREARVHIALEKDGSIDLTRLIVVPDASTPASNAVAAPARNVVPWTWSLRKASLDRYAVRFEDRQLAQPVAQQIEPIKLNLDNLSNRKGSQARVTLEAGMNKSGKLSASGPLTLEPLKADLKLRVQRLDLVPLQPYFEQQLNILVSSGDLSLGGELKVDGSQAGTPVIGFKGETTLVNFASVDKTDSEDFLKWRSLHVSGIDTLSAPFALRIEQVALSDFYSRLVLHADGRLNVQSVLAGEEALEQAADAAAKSEVASAKAAPAAKRTASKEKTVGPETAPAPADAGALPQVTISKVTLQGGNINFSDNFIKPNYSANLTDIVGSVSGLSSQLGTTADVDLRGRLDRAAPLLIVGKVNPLIQNLFLDLKADVRDIELGPLTPYSGKYVGYAIQKGKMSFDVEYKIADRKLEAKNRLVLNQLTFGDKIDSPDATKLPVLLAVALLKDRNGVIDVNLPISGSLDDPKFSIGGIVIRIIFNLIQKAVTAPFALIGALLGGGGGEELSYIAFEEGRDTLSADATDKLGKLQKALVERPALKLDITGHADAESDREGLRRYRFDGQVKAQKLKDQVKQGASVASLDEVKIASAEYEKYLERAYKAAKFPKPRNAIGLTKSLPKEEMEKLMLTNIQVSDDDLLKLANQRSQVAKDFLIRDQQIAAERVFLLAPKVEAGASGEQKESSRVIFSLK